METGTQRLDRAVQVYFQRTGLAPRMRSRFGQRTLLQPQLFDGFALSRRQGRDGLAQTARLLLPFGTRGGIVRARVRIQRVLVVQLTPVAPAMATQGIDRTTAGDGTQPGVVGTARVIGVTH